MGSNHSEDTHRNLLERVQKVTGRELTDWFHAIEEGPSFSRLDERVNWLSNEHAVPHGFATAIVREHEKRRAARG